MEFFYIYIYYFIFNFTILYWFCHISTWIRHRYTRVPHSEPSSLLPPRTIQFQKFILFLLQIFTIILFSLLFLTNIFRLHFHTLNFIVKIILFFISYNNILNRRIHISGFCCFCWFSVLKPCFILTGRCLFTFKFYQWECLKLGSKFLQRGFSSLNWKSIWRLTVKNSKRSFSSTHHQVKTSNYHCCKLLCKWICL